MEFAFDQGSLFLLGNMKSYKFDNVSPDCFIIRVNIQTQWSLFQQTNMIDQMSGAYLGTTNNDYCKGLATNRYDNMVVTSSS